MDSKTRASNKASKDEKEVNPFLEGVRKVLLAGLGAAALAQDELEDFVKRLVERGEIAEQDAKKLIEETRAKRNKRSGTAEERISKRMEELLERLNVPTKHDLKTLTDKINALSKKVDELKKTQG
jgi:poly(hydroxyalkanoate) granule-associated protein